MITLSAMQFDPEGVVSIHESPETQVTEITKRVTRRKTLDLVGVHIDVRGLFHGDRDFVITFTPRDKAQYLAVKRLVELYAILYVATAEGLFEAAPESINLSDGQAEVRLLVYRKIQ